MAFIRPALSQDAALLLRTGTVVLRPPQMSDHAAWAELRGASRAHLTPYEPEWTSDELSRGAFRERLRRYHRDQRSDAGYAFFILTDNGRELVGGITLSNMRRGVAQTASIGYWVAASRVRQGFAIAGLRAVTRFAFAHLRLHRLEAACMPANTPSLRTLERGGFTREGIARRYLKINGAWEDHVLFALTVEDWPEGETR